MLRVLTVLAIGLLSWGFPLEAQEAKRKIAFLAVSPLPYESAFNSMLRQLGWEEGRNVVVERRYVQSGSQCPKRRMRSSVMCQT